MANATVVNYAVSNTFDFIQGWWKLTRTMLAAGWKYRASGDTLVRDTSGVSGTGDRWAIGGAINTVQVASQTGTAAVIGAPSLGVTTITGVSGFTAASVGRYVRLTGYNNNTVTSVTSTVTSGNNGIFRITAQGGTTVSVFNPNATAETGNALATWTEMYGGAAATIATAGTNGATPGRAKITGLTNMKIASTIDRGSVGNRLTILNGAIGANNGSFLITRVISATEVEIENSSATSVSETNNGSIQWVEIDTTQQAYPLATLGTTVTGGWINLQGPSTLKIPISNGTPTGTFLKGETVTQATTGAKGTVIGVLIDTGTSLGYLVVLPQINGTGGGVRGWATGNVITGSLSGATIAQNGTAIEYVRECVFWKGNSTELGHWFQQVVDQSSESAQRFSTLATAGAVTPTLAPGGSTGTFPALAWVCIGQGGSNSATTGQNKFSFCSSTSNLGAFHLLCANCIGTDGIAEDGSWNCMMGAAQSTPTGYQTAAFMICDNSEDGDVDPYITVAPRNTAAFAGSRTAAAAVPATHSDHMYVSNFGSGSTTFFQGWRRRGMSTGDAWQEFGAFILIFNNSTGVTATANDSPSRVAHTFNQRAIPTKEPIWVASWQTGFKMRKGTMRWWYMVQGGISGVLYEDGLFVGAGTSLSTPIIIGPWDRVSPASNG